MQPQQEQQQPQANSSSDSQETKKFCETKNLVRNLKSTYMRKAPIVRYRKRKRSLEIYNLQDLVQGLIELHKKKCKKNAGKQALYGTQNRLSLVNCMINGHKIFLSDHRSANCLQTLQKNNIVCVITLGKSNKLQSLYCNPVRQDCTAQKRQLVSVKKKDFITLMRDRDNTVSSTNTTKNVSRRPKNFAVLNELKVSGAKDIQLHVFDAEDERTYFNARKLRERLYPQTRRILLAATRPDAAQGNILVHCKSGICRSPLVVADYLHNVMRMPLEEALRRTTKFRWCVSPGDILLSSLLSHEP